MPHPSESHLAEAPVVHLPLYAKAALVGVALALLVFTVHVAGEIIFPLGFAGIFAVLLHPIEQWLRRHRVPELLAIGLTVLLGVVVVLGLVFFIYLEALQLGEQAPLFKTKFAAAAQQLTGWLNTRFGVTDQKINSWLNEGASRLTGLAGGTLSALTRLLVVLALVPVYVFLLLLYQDLLVAFLTQVFSGRRRSAGVAEVLRESKTTVQSYMVGLLIEGSIVSALNVTALLILGVPYALLLGVLGGLLNFIPYIGGFVAILLPTLMAFVTQEGYGTALGVVGLYVVIQFLDNHLLIPRIVASKVKVNALVAIVGVLIGNAIGGVAGMFLALPTIAVLKIVFDRIPALKPWGLVLGDGEVSGTPGRKITPATAPVLEVKDNALLDED